MKGKDSREKDQQELTNVNLTINIGTLTENWRAAAEAARTDIGFEIASYKNHCKTRLQKAGPFSTSYAACNRSINVEWSEVPEVFVLTCASPTLGEVDYP